MLFDYGFVVSYLAVGCLAQLFIVRILAGLTLTEWAGGTLTYDVGLEPPLSARHPWHQERWVIQFPLALGRCKR